MQYKLVRSKNRRRSVAMQVTRTGELVVRAPVLMPKFFIDKFVNSHTAWVEKQLKDRQEPKAPLHRHFLSTQSLEEYIKVKVGEYSATTGLHPTRLRFRHVQSYWGSCSPSGVLSFNHHLVHAPKEAVDYVIVHELCHLRYKGHGIRFWELVRKYYPKANEMRKVLRGISRR